MLFGTATLARRIEQAECSLVADMARAVGRRLGPDGIVIAPIGGGAAITAGAGSPLNKLAGLGFESVDEQALAEIEREFEGRGIPLQVELASLASPEIGAMLTRRGYTLTGFENVLALPLAPCPGPADGEIAIRNTTADESQRWVDVITTGFASPDTFDGPVSNEQYNREILEQIFDDTTTIDGFVRYLATRKGAVAGAASMRLSNGIAQLCGAATLPNQRRRGVQTALLLRRLSDAARNGCDIAIVTTQPGSKSQENVQRQGFSLLYARALLVRSWTAGGR